MIKTIGKTSRKRHSHAKIGKSLNTAKVSSGRQLFASNRRQELRLPDWIYSEKSVPLSGFARREPFLAEIDDFEGFIIDIKVPY